MEEMNNMEDDVQEYVVFTVTDKDGKEVELAVIDEFEFEDKNYVAAAKIDGDTIDEDGVYIYRAVASEDDFTAEKITDPAEYEKVTKAYLEM